MRSSTRAGESDDPASRPVRKKRRMAGGAIQRCRGRAEGIDVTMLNGAVPLSMARSEDVMPGTAFDFDPQMSEPKGRAGSDQAQPKPILNTTA